MDGNESGVSTPKSHQIDSQDAAAELTPMPVLLVLRRMRRSCFALSNGRPYCQLPEPQANDLRPAASKISFTHESARALVFSP
jgi:hypothetical protein